MRNRSPGDELHEVRVDPFIRNILADYLGS
jgi:hypothetical protein